MGYLNDERCGLDILLVQPPNEDAFITTESTHIPTGLGALAAYLENQNKNISTEILDMRIYHNPYKLFFKILRDKKPKIVGLPSYTPALHKTVEVAQKTKKFSPEIKVIVGGMHATALPIETIQTYDCFDYLVYGEGEVTLYELLISLKNEKDTLSLKGTAVRLDGKVKLNPPRELVKDIDSLPFLARGKIDMLRYKRLPMSYLRLPTTEMTTARGCSYSCIFCPGHIVWGNGIRSMSPERVIKEITHCIDDYSIRDIFFVDDVFTWPKTRIVDICNSFIKNGLGISWSCYSRVDTVDYDLLRLMRKAGCYNIKYGIEAGTEKSLKAINKGTSLKQAEDAVRWTKMARIECFTSFIIGFGGESEADIKQTINFAKKLNPDLADFRIAASFPGTQLFEDCKHGNNSTPSLTPELFEDTPFGSMFLTNLIASPLRKKAYLSFYSSPKWIWQLFMSLFKNPRREIKKICYGIFVIWRLLKAGRG